MRSLRSCNPARHEHTSMSTRQHQSSKEASSKEALGLGVQGAAKNKDLAVLSAENQRGGGEAGGSAAGRGGGERGGGGGRGGVRV
jgi:hypothetical protein